LKCLIFWKLFKASVSVRNVRNLPKSNLTVKPEPSDPKEELQLSNETAAKMFNNNFDDLNKMTNSYYGSAQDTKYAKTTSLLTDRSNALAATNPFSSLAGGYNDYPSNLNGNSILATSTPMQANSGALDDYYSNNLVANSLGDGLYAELQKQRYQQQMLYNSGYPLYQSGAPYSMRRAGSRAEIDMLERDTSSQLRVRPTKILSYRPSVCSPLICF